MSVAQTRAARRKFRAYYQQGPIGQPRYKRKSVEKQQRREQQLREKAKIMAGRKKK